MSPSPIPILLAAARGCAERDDDHVGLAHDQAALRSCDDGAFGDCDGDGARDLITASGAGFLRHRGTP